MSDGSDKHLSLASPLGDLTIWGGPDGLTRLDWWRQDDRADVHAHLHAARAELIDYFAGRRQVFTAPIAPMPGSFRTRFSAALMAIPFGQTLTYGDLARDLGVSAQAIGQACGANPIPIIIPCHRVLAADGLGGFSGRGGIEAKVTLLRHEGAASLLI